VRRGSRAARIGIALVVVVVFATAQCSVADTGQYTFEAVVAMVDIGDNPALWQPCSTDWVLRDGDEVVLSDPSASGGAPLGVSRLADGKRIPVRETFAGIPAYSTQPIEAKACTWTVKIPNVSAGRKAYELRVSRLPVRLSNAQVRDGVRLAVKITGGDSVDVFPA
jgi:hypothetical protein